MVLNLGGTVVKSTILMVSPAVVVAAECTVSGPSGVTAGEAGRYAVVPRDNYGNAGATVPAGTSFRVTLTKQDGTGVASKVGSLAAAAPTETTIALEFFTDGVYAADISLAAQGTYSAKITMLSGRDHHSSTF